MNKFAWTLRDSGWCIQKIAQAPTAAEYKAVADEAAAKQKKNENKAMEAITGSPMSTNPQEAKKQILNVVPAAVGKTISDHTGGVMGGGRTADEVVKGLIEPAMKGLDFILGSDSDTIKTLSTSEGRSQALKSLNEQLNKVQLRKIPNPEIVNLIKKRISMVNSIGAGQMTPQQYVEAERARMASEMKR
jgi:hypothetical protein